ncbi:MAG: hypothetical protein PGN07_10010 [Aeromicrobium erythreum]
MAGSTRRSADRVVSWLAWGLLVLVDLGVAATTLLVGVVSQTTCGTASPDAAAVCTDGHGNTLVVAGAALGLLALVATVGSLVRIVDRGRQGRRAWPWPVGALVLVTAGSWLWFEVLDTVG